MAAALVGWSHSCTVLTQGWGKRVMGKSVSLQLGASGKWGPHRGCEAAGDA